MLMDWGEKVFKKPTPIKGALRAPLLVDSDFEARFLLAGFREGDLSLDLPLRVVFFLLEVRVVLLVIIDSYLVARLMPIEERIIAQMVE